MVIDKIKKVNKEEKRIKNEKASDMLIGKWMKCDNCKEILYKEDVHNNFSVCPNCGKHFRISARRRIKQIADDGTFEEIGANIVTKDPLQFDGYLKKVEALKEKTKIEEAVKCGSCKINGEEVVIDGTCNIEYVPLCGECYLKKVKKINFKKVKGEIQGENRN